MNVLKREKKAQALNALIEGNSIRSTERMTGVHRDTIMRLLTKTGNTCQEIMDNKVRNFHCKHIQVDEIWPYVLKKDKHLTDEEKRSNQYGSQYCYVAMDADSKLVSNYLIGKRDMETSVKFIADLQNKIKNNGRVQITSDGWQAYPEAVELAFGGDVDFAQLVKLYSGEYSDIRRYSPPKSRGILSNIINGMPNPKHISTSFVERQNLTMRISIRRLTNAFSKKLENLKSAVALHFYHYNFMRRHRSLRVTPAMAARITSHIWVWEDIL
ncbi:MAG: IS1 family transposase [Candidatus Scalindua sp.]